MFSLLRNIRQILIAHGANRKYLLYATGEFILIVAGILVALQIDNWNENRKQQGVASQYIKDIYHDLVSSISQLDAVTEQLGKESNAAEYILRTMDLPNPEIPDSEKMYQAFTDIGSPRIVIDENNVFRVLNRSGQLGIVRDRQMLKQLTDFYVDFDTFVSQYNEQAVMMKRDLQKYWSADTFLEEWLWERESGKNHINQIRRLLESTYFYQLLIQNLVTADVNQSNIEELKNKSSTLLSALENTYPPLLNIPG